MQNLSDPGASAAAAMPTGGIPPWLVTPVKWLYIWGDPGTTDATYGVFIAGLITWVKVLAWAALICWAGSWIVNALRRRSRSLGWVDWLPVAGLVLGLGAMLFHQYVSQREVKVPPWALTASAAVPIVLFLVWIEWSLWRGVLTARSSRGIEVLVLILAHLAVALGMGVSAAYLNLMQAQFSLHPEFAKSGIRYNDPVFIATRGSVLAGTYIGLVVLARICATLAGELASVRARRILAIAKLTFIECVRVLKAPWVVISIFVVIGAFTHWFLQPPEDQRAAELSRLYVSASIMLMTMLLLSMTTLTVPVILPRDIENQTIYTVATKPVRRLEMVWGRMLGVLALVTILIAVFGGAGLLYLQRTVNNAVAQARREADEVKGSAPLVAQQKLDEAKQLESRMAARVPIRGLLTFSDSKGEAGFPKGIDVGQEQEYRSHIEGATPATASWAFGDRIPNPIALINLRIQKAKNPNADFSGYQIPMESRPLDVTPLLVPGSIEELEHRYYTQMHDSRDLDAKAQAPGTKASDASGYRARSQELATRAKGLVKEILELKDKDKDLNDKADAAQAAGDAEKARGFRREALYLHSPDVTLETSFTIYRTTKGIITQAVQASVEVVNLDRNPADEEAITPIDPKTQVARRDSKHIARNTQLPDIREYYTTEIKVPAGVFAGCRGNLEVKVRCTTPMQYLGMAEGDLYILASRGTFWVNYLKGLYGIWLQTLILVAVGVFAGTFLSWRVAFLCTLFFFVAGQVAFSFLSSFFETTAYGGGPFESFIRLVTHNNQMSDLDPTLGVIVAKALDSIATPVLATTAYFLPNFAAFDFRNLVADGFAVDGWTLLQSTALALAYALPFSFAAYFILKNREVAA